MIIGYLVHVWSHHTDFERLYTELLHSNGFFGKMCNSFPNVVNKGIKWVLGNIIDFHDKIHHNSNINTKWYNVLTEAIENLLMEGGFIIIISKLLKLQIGIMGETCTFNYAIIAMWALIYTSTHLINYTYIIPNAHIEHHKNYHKNYGIDTLDIIFNTKDNLNNPEIINHYAINVIIVTILIVLFRNGSYNNSFMRILSNALK